MNRNLQLSHLCNVDDLYFRLVSAAVYETKQHSSSINPLIFQAIIKEILDEFLRNFSISLSHFLHISSHPIFSSYPSFLAELVDYLPVADHKKNLLSEEVDSPRCRYSCFLVLFLLY